MTVAQKNLFAEALKLPKQLKMKLAEELLASAYKQNSEWNDAVLEGARIAQRRLTEARSGKSRVISEDAIEAIIEEAQRDWKAYKAGRMKGTPIEQVFPKVGKKRKTSRGSNK